MNQIKLLDCTLRDGGYVNQWDFGEPSIRDIILKLVHAKIDIIECGFLSQKKSVGKGCSIFPTIEAAEEYLPKEEVPAVFACMINYGEYDPQDLPDAKGRRIQTLRVAFHRSKLSEALLYCRKLREKGYRVFVQPMATASYSDQDMALLIREANDFKPEAVYLVDSFGTLQEDNVKKLFCRLDRDLDAGIPVGFHSHNNLQLSYANAQALLKIPTNREIFLDASVYGMGRGAGNLCTELIARHLNLAGRADYNIISLLEIVDEHLNRIFARTPWGYSVPYYIAAANDCHPNYATFLLNKQTISVTSIHDIIGQIEDSKKHEFDKEYIEKLYMKYQTHAIADADAVAKLSEQFRGGCVLVLAPGHTIQTEADKIFGFLRENPMPVISINGCPEGFAADYVFVSNQKRYKQMNEQGEAGIRKIPVICTSNIQAEEKDVLKINYSDYLSFSEAVRDNAGLMLLNLLMKVGAKKAYLAGFDGYQPYQPTNYYSDRLITRIEEEKLLEINAAMEEQLGRIHKKLDLEWITTTNYRLNDVN